MPKKTRTVRQEPEPGVGVEPTIDIAFVGIGCFIKGEALFDDADVVGLPTGDFRKKIAGEILHQPFDENGQLLDCDVRQQVGAMPLLALREMVDNNKPVVVITRGREKACAVLAAWKGGYFDFLVLDTDAADELYKLISNPLTS